MILLVFEGQVGEPKVMTTLQHLYFSDAANYILCSYGTDTYTLWKDVKRHELDGEADVFAIMKERLHSGGDHSLDQYDSYQIESIYLFFDYDPQNNTIPPHLLNQAISEMVALFDDPMDKGKIFISYPMLEGLFCLNSIPDVAFLHSVVSIADCHGFKGWCKQFLFGKNPELLIYKTDKDGRIVDDPSMRKQELLQKWNALVTMTANKANLICHGVPAPPDNVDDISQNDIFQHQLEDYVVPNSCISILSAFPLFLFDYFHGNGVI